MSTARVGALHAAGVWAAPAGAPVAAPVATLLRIPRRTADPGTVALTFDDGPHPRGTPLVLNVWGSWCPGCNAEAADLARFARSHPNVQVIGIDTQDTSGGAKSFYRKWGWQHPSIADPKGELAARLGVQGYPTTFFLNARHRVVTQIIGATSLAGFNQGLAAAMSRS